MLCSWKDFAEIRIYSRFLVVLCIGRVSKIAKMSWECGERGVTGRGRKVNFWVVHGEFRILNRVWSCAIEFFFLKLINKRIELNADYQLQFLIYSHPSQRTRNELISLNSLSLSFSFNSPTRMEFVDYLQSFLINFLSRFLTLAVRRISLCCVCCCLRFLDSFFIIYFSFLHFTAPMPPIAFDYENNLVNLKFSFKRKRRSGS